MQNGNVLFLILIAVALFAALSYSITASTRSGGGNTGSEKVDLQVSQLFQYASGIENAILRLRVSHGCDASQISFERTPFDGSDITYVNANSPANFRCHVFHPNGGGQSYIEYPASLKGIMLEPVNFKTGTRNVPQIGLNENADLYLQIAFSVDKNAWCQKINEKMGVAAASDNVPTAVGNFAWGNVYFNGTFTDNGGTLANAAVYGKRDFCLRHSTTLRANYFHTLIAR